MWSLVLGEDAGEQQHTRGAFRPLMAIIAIPSAVNHHHSRRPRLDHANLHTLFLEKVKCLLGKGKGKGKGNVKADSAAFATWKSFVCILFYFPCSAAIQVASVLTAILWVSLKVTSIGIQTWRDEWACNLSNRLLLQLSISRKRTTMVAHYFSD